MKPVHALAGKDQVPFFVGVSVAAWGRAFGGNTRVEWAGRKAAGGRAGCLSWSPSQSEQKHCAASVVTQASRGGFL